MVVTVIMINLFFIASHSLNSLDGGKDEQGASFILLKSCEFIWCQSHSYRQLNESHMSCNLTSSSFLNYDFLMCQSYFSLSTVPISFIDKRKNGYISFLQQICFSLWALSNSCKLCNLQKIDISFAPRSPKYTLVLMSLSLPCHYHPRSYESFSLLSSNLS